MGACDFRQPHAPGDGNVPRGGMARDGGVARCLSDDSVRVAVSFAARGRKAGGGGPRGTRVGWPGRLLVAESFGQFVSETVGAYTDRTRDRVFRLRHGPA